MPYLLGLFHLGMCRVGKLGAISKTKTCKIDRIVWEMHAISVYQVLGCMHAYPLPIHCAEIPKLRHTEWAVGTHACIHSQKENAKLHIACISHTIRSILQVFVFGIAPQFTNLARAPVKQS